MQREPWTYSLIEMHNAASDLIFQMVRLDNTFTHYGFSVERVCRCEFSDGGTHFLVWLETTHADEAASDDLIEVALWLEEQLEDCGYASGSFSVMLNGVEIS